MHCNYRTKVHYNLQHIATWSSTLKGGAFSPQSPPGSAPELSRSSNLEFCDQGNYVFSHARWYASWCGWSLTLISVHTILTCSRSTSPPDHIYYIDNTILNRTNQHAYLGVLFHSQMSFSPHINNIANNPMKSLNFVRWNLNDCNESVKATAYLGLVHPKLEYASAAVWDLHLSKDINTIAWESSKNSCKMGEKIIIGRTVCQTCSLNCSGRYYLRVDTFQNL